MYTEELHELADADASVLRDVFGEFDINVCLTEQKFSVKVKALDGIIKVVGDNAENTRLAKTALLKLAELRKLHTLTEQNARYIIDAVADGEDLTGVMLSDSVVIVSFSGKPVKAKTVGQGKYVKAIRDNTVTFGTGPAGTGKTYLAVALAVRALRAHEVSRIILTRPAVEAGEKLGFLPGDLQNKVDPYLRPLYDALYDIMGAETFARNLEKNVIEVAPLAYMRGRTLDESFIILDEAQNTTPEQMKMFLTRLGWGSKAVVTGDTTQTDYSRQNGLADALRVLHGVESIGICRLSDKDVVRHKLVRDIIKAYEKSEKSRA